MVRWNLCKKVPGKKFLEKNMEIKTSEKSPIFLKSFQKNVTGNKVLYFGLLGLLGKIVLGLSMSQEIRSQEIQSWGKYIRRKKKKKKVLNLVKMSLSIRRSHKKDFFYASVLWIKSSGCYLISFAPFCMVVYILCSYAFSTRIGLFFRGRFCIKSYWRQKKSPKK